MSRRRPPRRRERPLRGGAEQVEEWPDGDWMVRSISGAASTKAYRCPGCLQEIRPVTPHLVVWPVLGATLSGGGVDERRHWHSGCWQARLRHHRR